MGLERALVRRRDDLLGGRDDLGRLRVFLAADEALLLHQLVAFRVVVGRAGLGAVAEVPFDRKQIERRLGAVPGVRDDRDGILQVGLAALAGNRLELHGRDHAGTALDRIEVVALQRPPRHRARLHGGIDHAGHARIDGVLRAAVDLVRDVEALPRLAEQPPLGRIGLDLRLLVERHPGRGLGELAVGAAAAARRQHAELRFDLGTVDAPGLRGGLLEALARRGAGAHEVRMLQAHELRAVRAHHLVFLVVAQVPVGVGELGLDLRPVDVELLGDQHRDRGDAALAHLGVRDADGDGAVLVDHEPGVDLGAARGRGRLRPRTDARGQGIGHVEAEHQPAAGGDRGLEEGTAGKNRFGHVGLPMPVRSGRRDGSPGRSADRFRNGRDCRPSQPRSRSRSDSCAWRAGRRPT